MGAALCKFERGGGGAYIEKYWFYQNISTICFWYEERFWIMRNFNLLNRSILIIDKAASDWWASTTSSPSAGQIVVLERRIGTPYPMRLHHLQRPLSKWVMCRWRNKMVSLPKSNTNSHGADVFVSHEDPVQHKPIVSWSQRFLDFEKKIYWRQLVRPVSWWYKIFRAGHPS